MTTVLIFAVQTENSWYVEHPIEMFLVWNTAIAWIAFGGAMLSALVLCFCRAFFAWKWQSRWKGLLQNQTHLGLSAAE